MPRKRSKPTPRFAALVRPVPGRGRQATQDVSRRPARRSADRRDGGSASAKADDWLFPRLGSDPELEDASLLDVVDSVVNHGVVLQGDLILGVANVDLIYIKLSALAGALDKISKRAGSGINRAASSKHAQQKNASRRTGPKRSRARRRSARNANR